MALSLLASCMDVNNDNNSGSPVQTATSLGEPGLQNCNLEQWLPPRKHPVVVTAETDKASSDRPTIRFSITNTTRDSIYFLNRSCDGFLRFVYTIQQRIQ